MMDLISVQEVPLLCCLVMLVILAYIGIHVLKREVIFIDIALAQIAAVGAIGAHVVFHLHGDSLYAHGLALGSTLCAAAFFAVVRRSVTQIPLEAVIGVAYAVAAAAALFLVGVAPGGHVHIQEMLSGSILWATWGDFVRSAAVFAVVGACFYVFRKPFRTISEDYEGAVKRGQNTFGWDFLFYALVGVVITEAVRIAGVVVVFTFLIIPATFSVMFTGGWGGRVATAWLGGGVSAALGLLFANRHDFSVGPAIGLFLGGTLIVVSVLRWFRVAKLATAGAWLVSAVALGAWLVSGSTAHEPPIASGFGDAPVAGSITHAHPDNPGPTEPAPDENGSDTLDHEPMVASSDVDGLRRAYEAAQDDGARSDVVCRLLETDIPSGVEMAVAFLGGDPPLLFRMTVVEKVEDVTGKEFSYDINLPFDAVRNQEAVAELEKNTGGHDG